MTISHVLLVGYCHGYRFFMGFRHSYFTSRQHFLNGRDDLVQQPRLTKRITAGQANIPLGIMRLTGGNAKSHPRYTSIKFKKISDNMNKRLRLAGMDEADRRRVPRRQNGCLTNTIQTGSGRGQTPVG